MYFKKSKDPFKILLALKTTHVANGYSSAKLLMGRKLRRNVPITQEQLKSQLPTRETLFKREVVNKNNQKIHFDSHYRTKDLPEVSVCDKV